MPLDITDLIFICIQMRNVYHAYTIFEILAFKNLRKTKYQMTIQLAFLYVSSKWFKYLS